MFSAIPISILCFFNAILQFERTFFDKGQALAACRTILMEIIEDWHGKRSTLITSQVPVSKWHEVIGEQTIADAILNRIIHDSHRLELKGESMRKKRTILTEEITENDN